MLVSSWCLSSIFYVDLMSFGPPCAAVLPSPRRSGYIRPSIQFKTHVFTRAKLTAALRVGAACETGEACERRAPIGATCTLLHNWLHSVFSPSPTMSYMTELPLASQLKKRPNKKNIVCLGLMTVRQLYVYMYIYMYYFNQDVSKVNRSGEFPVIARPH